MVIRRTASEYGRLERTDLIGHHVLGSLPWCNRIDPGIFGIGPIVRNIPRTPKGEGQPLFSHNFALQGFEK